MFDPRQQRRFLSSAGDATFVERFGDPFRPLESECRVVQFQAPLTPAQLQQAGAIMAARPDVELYAYGGASRDLDFLAHFATLRRLHVALYELADMTGFAHVPALEALTFGKTKATFSLRFLERLPALTKLFLVGHKKDLASIQSLMELRSLGLSGITLPDLSLLLRLKALRKLQLFLGSTADLSLLPRLADLEELSLMRITKLGDLTMLGDAHGLKSLRLDWMRNVTRLPSFARLTRLENVELDAMKGITDLTPIAAAPALRRLVVTDMRQLTADSFRCLLGHPRLQELHAYTGKSSVNAAIMEMFPSIARGEPPVGAVASPPAG
jgi:internalin A